jgi:DNA-binding transcriptional MerR regulator
MRSLRTSDLARAVGVHPNTVRRYVARGILPPVEYSPSGYHRFTAYQLDCLRLARQVYRPPYPGRALFLSGVRIIQSLVGGELARRHLVLVQAERAADLLEHRASDTPEQSWTWHLRIGEAARTPGVSIEILGKRDRNGLLDVPRDPASGYRCYGAQELGRLCVMRMLSCTGYSLSAILRMLLGLDRGETNLQRALDSPGPDEDARLASDRWLSTLAAHLQRAHTIIALLSEIGQANPPYAYQGFTIQG